jgi:frataxin-like iron-binding protein CyaY
LWLAVKGGLLGFDPQLGSITFFSHPASETGQDLPTALVFDASGNFWLGTNGAGLYRFSPRNGEWVHYQNDPNDAYSLSQNQVSGLLLDRTGILWIQFLSGDVDRFDPRAGFRIYQQARGNPNSLSGDTVTSILVDSTGSWWVGTLGNGLNRYEPATGRWTHFRHDPNRPNSLSDDQVPNRTGGPFIQSAQTRPMRPAIRPSAPCWLGKMAGFGWEPGTVSSINWNQKPATSGSFPRRIR